MYRGCLSESSNGRLLCDEGEKQNLGFCKRCSESGCNNIPKITEPKLSCFKCNDEKACAFAQDVQAPQACKNEVHFGDEESCFTHSFDSID